jgi:hypothetical protein
MKKTNRTFSILIFILIAFSQTVLADTYSCQRNDRVRFQSSSPCPNGSQTLVVVKDKAIFAPDYAIDAKQQADAQRERGYAYQSPVDSNKQQVRPQSDMQPRNDQVYAAQRKEKSCEANWESIRSIDQAARINSTEGLRNERKRLMDERWSLGC